MPATYHRAMPRANVLHYSLFKEDRLVDQYTVMEMLGTGPGLETILSDNTDRDAFVICSVTQ